MDDFNYQPITNNSTKILKEAILQGSNDLFDQALRYNEQLKNNYQELFRGIKVEKIAIHFDKLLKILGKDYFFKAVLCSESIHISPILEKLANFGLSSDVFEGIYLSPLEISLYKDLILQILPPKNLVECVLSQNIEFEQDGDELKANREDLASKKELLIYAFKHGANLNSCLLNNILGFNLELLNEVKDFIFSPIIETDKPNQLTLSKLASQIINASTSYFSYQTSSTIKYKGYKDLKDNLLKQIFAAGFTLTFRESESKDTLLEKLLDNDDFATFDLIREWGYGNEEISVLDYFSILSETKPVSWKIEVIKRFPNTYSYKELTEIALIEGIPEVRIKQFDTLNSLILDYMAAKAGEFSGLTKLELDLLGDEKLDFNIKELKESGIGNKYNLKPVDLALLSYKFELAKEMILSGFEISTKADEGLNTISILTNYVTTSTMTLPIDQKENLLQTVALILEKIDDVDDLFYNESHFIYEILLDDACRQIFLERTNNSLFKFFKTEENLFKPTENQDETSIAVLAPSEYFWFSGFSYEATLISKIHPNVKFYLVNQDLVEKGGDGFIKQFDGFIGAGNTGELCYIKEFSKSCLDSSKQEGFSQLILEKSNEFGIPYFGIGRDAHNLVLYHEGVISKLSDNYHKSQEITFIPGTVPHLFALESNQQQNVLKTCNLPKVSFEVDVFNYIAKPSKIGDKVILGAHTEENWPMFYMHENGIRYGAQFHLEDYYDILPIKDETNHQHELMENFLSLTNFKHLHKLGYSKSPEEVVSLLDERLKSCLNEENACYEFEDPLAVNNTCLNYEEFFALKYIL